MKKNISKDIEWIFARLRKPPFIWHLASSITIATVGFLSKVITGTCNFNHLNVFISFIRKHRLRWFDFKWYNFPMEIRSHVLFIFLLCFTYVKSVVKSNADLQQ